MLRRLSTRVRALWNWRRKESELDEEIQFHLSEEADERTAAGLTGDQARLAARRDFGNATLIRETTRETWGWGFAERLIQDARCALRMMRRDRGFSAVAVLTLALGIGATTAILTVVNGVLVRPLPFADADRLVVLFATTPRHGVDRDTTSFHDIAAWRDQSHAFDGVAAYRQDSFNITGDGRPEPVRGLRASHELLNVLGVSPAIGRTFDRDEQQGGAAVALISHGLWTRRYGRDPGLLDRTILLNDVSHAVIGVLPAGFEFLPFQDTDVIVPVPERTCRSCGYIRAVARLKAGVPAAVAQQELDAIAAGLAKAFPDSNEGRGVNVVPLQDVAVGPVRTPILVLLGAGAFVLLIGCGNVGNLVLARAVARQRELAVRSALGAGRGRLVRQLLTESLALAVAAGVLGSALAFWGSELLVASLAQRFSLPEIDFNWGLLAFAFLIAVLAGVLSGLPPALMASRADLNGALKLDGRSQSDGVAHHRLRNLLMVSQTALTVMLLIGAGLLVKSFVRLQRVDLGWNPRHVLTADLLLSKRYADRRTARFSCGQSWTRLPRCRAFSTPRRTRIRRSTVAGGARRSRSTGGRTPGRRTDIAPASISSTAIFSGPWTRGGSRTCLQQARHVPHRTGRRRQRGDGAAVLAERRRHREAPAVLLRQGSPAVADHRRRGAGHALQVRGLRAQHAVHQRAALRAALAEPVPLLPYAPAWFVSLVVRTANDPAGSAAAVQAAIGPWQRPTDPEPAADGPDSLAVGGGAADLHAAPWHLRRHRARDCRRGNLWAQRLRGRAEDA